MNRKEVKVEELAMNPFTKIGKEWLLVTAGDEANHNTMTASWGAMGIMWGKNAVTIYIRPQRYTKEFLDQNELFTISVLGEEYRKALNYCGTVTGRGIDKIREAGLTACAVDGTTAIDEANLILVCKKMYHDEIRPEGFDEKEYDNRNYKDGDYHTMYIAEIVRAYVSE